MNTILSQYEKLTEERKKLEYLKKSMKDDPIKQLENWGETTALYDSISELKDSILTEIQANIGSLPKGEEISKVFKSIEKQNSKLQTLKQDVRTSGENESSLNFLKGMTTIQTAKNELIESVVASIKEAQPKKIRKSKM
jgi:hypothetical protein